MKDKILIEIDKRIKSKKAIIKLIKYCHQEEDQKNNVIIFKAQLGELKNLRTYIQNIK